MSLMYLAIDIGGTKTLICELDKSGEIISKNRFETPKDYSAFLALFEATYKKINFKTKPKYCIAGTPGIIDRSAGVAMAFGNLPWKNIPLAKDLENIVGLPVLLENDANLAGLSEAILEIKRFRKALYITVSTGIGGVLIVDGRIDPDTQDVEFGSMLFEHKGKLERWEDFASGSAIFKKFGKRASDIDDPTAWYVISHNLAVGLFDVIATLTPEVVIIGGGVGAHFDKFKDRLIEDLQIYTNEMVKLPTIIQSQRAEEAVIYGCYELGRQQHAK